MEKPWFVFGLNKYDGESLGGMSDFEGSFETQQEAKEFVELEAAKSVYPAASHYEIVDVRSYGSKNEKDKSAAENICYNAQRKEWHTDS